MAWDFDPVYVTERVSISTIKLNDLIITRFVIPSNIGIDLFNLNLSWNPPTLTQGGITIKNPGVIGYEAEIKKGDSGEWGLRQTILSSFVSFPNLTIGEYYARVRCVLVGRSTSSWLESGLITSRQSTFIANFSAKISPPGQPSQGVHSMFALEF